MLRVIEQHEGDASTFARLKVELNLEPITPHQVEHRFDSHRQTVSHRFFLKNVPTDQLSAGMVVVKRLADIKRNAWTTRDGQKFPES